MRETLDVPSVLSNLDSFEPIGDRIFAFLENKPGFRGKGMQTIVSPGVSHCELLEIFGLTEGSREIMEEYLVVKKGCEVVGRGPGLVIVHPNYLSEFSESELRVHRSRAALGDRLDATHQSVLDVLQGAGEEGMSAAELLDGLRGVTRGQLIGALHALRRDYRVTTTGNKRSTRYHAV